MSEKTIFAVTAVAVPLTCHFRNCKHELHVNDEIRFTIEGPNRAEVLASQLRDLADLLESQCLSSKR